MSVMDDLQIKQSFWFICCPRHGERYPCNIRERGKRKIFFTSETNSVDILDYCGHCLVVFKVLGCTI